MPNLSRWRMLPALLVVPVLLAGSALQPASAHPTHPQHHHNQRWAHPHASLRTAPRRLLHHRSQHGRSQHGPVRITSIREVNGRPRVNVTTRRTPAAATAAIAAAQDAPGAVAVSVDHRVRAQAIQSNDTDRWAQWALDRLHAESLWAQQPGDGVVVAVVDTGVDAAHPDLQGVVLPGTDFVTPGGDGTADGNGHGTHVAGIIAAVANNHLGVAGLAQGVQILPVRVLDDTGSGWSSNIAQGIIWATDHGASVINLSLGGPTPDDVTAAAVQYAEDHGVVVVAAAGNDRATGDATSYPAAYPGVLGVAATDSQDQVASFSNTGSYVDLAAPGVDIASTYPPDQYVYLSGTSMATPFVSASAALLKAANPQLTAAQADQDLESTATDLPPAGRDDYSGYGLVDPSAALCAVTGCSGSAPASSPAPAPTTGSAPSPAPSTTAPVEAPVPAGPAATVTRLTSRVRTVAYGRFAHGRVTVLTQATGAGLADAPVQLCTQTRSSASPRCRSLTTNTDGVARYRLRIRRDLQVYAEYDGETATAASRSDVLDYRVAPLLHVRIRRHRLVARVAPAVHQLVRLQRWNGHRWVRVERAHVNARGRAAFTRLPEGRFRVRLRTHLPGDTLTSRARLVG